MKTNRWTTLAMALVLGGSSLLFAQAPDNTRNNKTQTPTADQQKQNRSDVDITQQIRKLITDDKALSTYAKNVKVVTQNGEVTLTGPVRNADEKTSIEKKAIYVAGANHVKNQLQIAAKETTQQPATKSK